MDKLTNHEKMLYELLKEMVGPDQAITVFNTAQTASLANLFNGFAMVLLNRIGGSVVIASEELESAGDFRLQWSSDKETKSVVVSSVRIEGLDATAEDS